MSIIEQIKAYVESRKNTAETIRERDICIDIIEVIDYIQEKSEKPTLQEQPVKDFPTTDEEMQHFLATHKPVQVPDKYKTADWIFKEQPVCDGLEEEINRTYYDRSVTDTSDIDHNSYENIARHFAQWQKEQDGIKATRIARKAIDAYKAEMLKDAVERIVKEDAGGYPYIDATELYDYTEDKPLAKKGDKVKIIIIKED